MKIQKSLIFSLLLVGLFSFTSMTAGTPFKNTNTSLSKVFKKYLKNVDVKDFNMKSETILIDFMINEKAEIIVLSTSEKVLDDTLKSKLNYKTIETGGELEFFKKYTVPVTFK